MCAQFIPFRLIPNSLSVNGQTNVTPLYVKGVRVLTRSDMLIFWFERV